jgi:hypothetical protein
MGLLLELEIDAACAEYLRMRGYPVAQPVVLYMDAPPEEFADENEGPEAA